MLAGWSGAPARHDAVAVRAHRAEFGERGVERAQRAARQLQHGQTAQTRLRVATHDPIGRGERLGRHAEHPLRRAELRRHRHQRADGPRRQLERA